MVKDKYGNFIMFGGTNRERFFSDVWEFNPNLRAWNLIAPNQVFINLSIFIFNIHSRGIKRDHDAI